jgi:hypothetical protein
MPSRHYLFCHRRVQSFLSSHFNRTNSAMRAAGLVWSLLFGFAASLIAQAPTAVPVLTWRYDVTHEGQNTSETALTPANVAPSTFGKLFSLSVDDHVFAQPLYVPNIKMSDGQVHNVVFVATENDSIYAFDADVKGKPIWQISLLTAAHGAGAGATPVPQGDVAPSQDIGPNIGITGTPAINSASNTMYVVANTKESGVYFSRLHAINIITGAEQSGSPVNITATVAGTGDGSSGGQLAFSPLWTNQRPGLDYYNGYVYIAYSSHGDVSPFHGWVFAYNASTLQQTAAICLSPDDQGASVWGSGASMPIDTSTGKMFVVTANGNRSTPFEASSDYGQSVIAFNIANGELTPVDEFTTYNWASLNTDDVDLGSGGVLMLPDQPGTNPHEIIAAGKEGRVTVLNRDNLGGMVSSSSTSNTNAVQDFVISSIPYAEGFWSTAAYWNGNVYMWAGGDDGGTPNVGMAFKLNNGTLGTTPSSETTFTSAFPGPTYSVSSNGTQDGIVWAVKFDQFNTGGPAVLYAFDPSDLSTVLYESDTNASRDSAGPANKFSVPVVTNGKVYVATKGEVDVYGLLNAQQTAAAPVISPNGGTFSAAQTVTLTSATSSASIYYTLDGTTPTTTSTLYSSGISISADTTLKAIATASGYSQSSVSSATFTFSNQAPAVSFSPAAGTYTNAQTVTLSDTDASAKIYYTTDGSTPSASSNLYSAPINVSASEAVKAIAIDPALQDSNVTTAAYVIQAGGTSINFGSGFSSTAGLTLNGTTAANGSGGLQLTTGQMSQAGSFFWNVPINIQTFTTTFQFQLTNAQGNGFTFTIQNMGPTALGGDSAGLAYQNITQSVALKFNFYNYENEGADSTGLYTDGEPPVTPTVDISSSGIQLGSGDTIQATIAYDGTTLTLKLLDMVTNDTFSWSQAINIPQTVGGDTAYVGFTGGTGGLSADQTILSWTYSTTGGGGGSNPSFSMSGAAVSISSPGASSTGTVTITPSGGFTGTVTVTCAVTSGPVGAIDAPACTASQPTVISGVAAVTSTLTISTMAASTTALHNPNKRIFALDGGTLAALILFCYLPLRRRRWLTLLSLMIFSAVAAASIGCATGVPANDPSNAGTTAGNYVITVTGASGSAKVTTTVNVTVE